MKTSDKKRINSRTHRGLSPILAVVVLLGITVVAGGMVFSLFSSSATTASTTDVIQIENAQAVKGSGHSDFTLTVKNAGSQPWTEVELTISKSELSEPIIYAALHEAVSGCDTTFDTAVNICDGTGNGGNEGKPAGDRDNPLRAQWLITLDKESGSDEEDIADKGEGAAVGRKMVYQPKDDLRSITVLDGTAVARIFGGNDVNGNSGATFGTGSTDYKGNIDTADFCAPSTAGSFVDCTDAFNALDSGVSGQIFCEGDADNDDIVAKCKVFTHQNIKDDPISSGESINFYANMLAEKIGGLDNQVVRVGDAIVANIATENADGGTSRVQSVIKVTGV
jgi:flagellin-like protein